MTDKEKKANDYCQKHKKSWEATIIAGDAYLAGYRQAREDCKNRLTGLIIGPIVLEEVGESKVEVEFKDGSHMTGAKISDSNSSE
jgi:hypothetical protein